MAAPSNVCSESIACNYRVVTHRAEGRQDDRPGRQPARGSTGLNESQWRNYIPVTLRHLRGTLPGRTEGAARDGDAFGVTERCCDLQARCRLRGGGVVLAWPGAPSPIGYRRSCKCL
jgi:hypothetical protein